VTRFADLLDRRCPIGIPPSPPPLGTPNRVGDNFLFPEQWWITIFPGAALGLMVLAINLLGDGLRNALDPEPR